MGADETRVRAVLTDFLQRADKAERRDNAVTDSTSLYGDGLGLDSLETAELSAVLEDEFGTDPFSAGERLPETVGDILAFYEVSGVV